MTLGETVALYVLLSAVEVYLFLMQRSALDMSRAHNIDPAVGREMLSSRYLLVWPVKLGRWVCLYLLWRQAGPMTVLVAWALVMAATTVLPVPHAHFRPMFQRRVSKSMLGPYGQNAPGLMFMLLQEETEPDHAERSRRDATTPRPRHTGASRAEDALPADTAQRTSRASREHHSSDRLLGENEMDPLTSLAEAGGLVLRRYVVVHNDIFALSLWRNLRRMIPIPGIFEAIPYGAHSRTLNVLRQELASLRPRAGELLAAGSTGVAAGRFLEEFDRYCDALTDAVSRLESICDSMDDKANGQQGPSWAEYQRDLQEYERSRDKHARLGKRLNDAYASAAPAA